MSFQTSRRGGTVIVRAEGRIDSRNAGALEACLPAADDARSNILIDLQDSDYMSSAGLRVLLAALKARRAVGRQLSCCGVQPSIRQVFDISGLSTHFDLHESQDAYFARAVQVAKEVPEPASLQQRNKEAVLQFLMAIQFQQFAELSAVTFDGMTTTHTPSLDAQRGGHEFSSSAEYSDYVKLLNTSKDIEIVIQSMIAEGDMVAVHNISTHTYADGRSMTTPYMSFYRLNDGKIMEVSHVYDRLHEQLQLA
jgi:stage II sporulation protein AA (anti-sigma F factor antagonist)